MFTFFAVPKPFNNRFKIIQRNSILSWLSIKPKQNVLLFGTEIGVKEIAKKYNLLHFAKIEENNYGTPLVNDIFKKASIASNDHFLCFLNSDIIVDPYLKEAFKVVSKRFRKFLIICRRWNCQIKYPIDFSKSNWSDRIKTRALKDGHLYSPFGIDLFIFPIRLFDSIPNFAIGRAIMDNWMIYYAKSLKIPVIDITSAVTIVHQDHYIKRNRSDKTTNHNGIESRENLRLASGYGYCFSAEDADYVLDSDFKIIKKKSNMKVFYNKTKRAIHRMVDPFLLPLLTR